MKKLLHSTLKSFFKDKFFTATFWMFLGTGFMNVGNYAYHLLMGNLLDVVSYGALESVISLLYILSVPTLTLNLVIVKFVASYKGKNQTASISEFHNFLSSKLTSYGLIILIVLLILSPLIKGFLHLPTLFLSIILPITFFLNLFYFLNKSFIHGLSDFFKLTILSIQESIVKVLLGIGLVLVGFKVDGAFGSIAVSILLGALLSYIFVKKLVVKTKKMRDFTDKKELLKFTVPTFLTSLSIISLFTTDIIIVRHFFPGVDSGYYSALSVLGKVIYFMVSPMVLVLFPLISESHAKNVSYTKILTLGVLFTALISGMITVIYFLFPDLMIGLLFGQKYLIIAPLLGLFGIFISIHSLNSLLANFYLSIHKTLPTLFLLLAAIGQIVGIIMFHKDLYSVIMVSIVISFLLLISLLLYYANAIRGK